jgi:hypothetical protein
VGKVHTAAPMTDLAYWIGSILCDGIAKSLRGLFGNYAECALDNTTAGYGLLLMLGVISIILITIKVFFMADKRYRE